MMFQYKGVFLLILVGVCSSLFYVKTSFFACDETISGATTVVNEKAVGIIYGHDTYDDTYDNSTSNHDDNGLTSLDDSEEDMFTEEEKEILLLSRSRRQSHVVNYKLQSAKFIQIMADCITDEYCHIHFLHTQKTGGTTIEEYFFKIFHEKMGRFASCCDEYVTNRFTNIHRRERNCLIEFMPAQLNASDFINIPIKICLEVHAHANQINTSSNATRKHHIVALATFREPYARTLSQIHQKCNKNRGKRTKELLAMCERCDYDQDQSEWNRLYIDETNAVYTSIYNDLILGTADIGIPVLTIDTLDISSFFQSLESSLPNEYTSELKGHKNIDSNKEEISFCNFGFRSAMMKNLQSSLEVYRNLTLGW